MEDFRLLWRFCRSSTSVKCLHTEARLRRCDSLPQHFLWCVLSPYCLFGPQMASPTSSSTPPWSYLILIWWGGVLQQCCVTGCYCLSTHNSSSRVVSFPVLLQSWLMRWIVGYLVDLFLDFESFALLSFSWLTVVPLYVNRMPGSNEIYQIKATVSMLSHWIGAIMALARFITLVRHMYARPELKLYLPTNGVRTICYQAADSLRGRQCWLTLNKMSVRLYQGFCSLTC